jgi:hypothetical protein
MTTSGKNIPENISPKALTSIHEMYTLSATDGHYLSEIDILVIKHFLETLAEVALTIASRKGGR